MSYHISLKIINDTERSSSVFYTEEDLVKFLVKLKNGFTIFEGKIFENGYKDLSEIHIIERNWDGLDIEGNPAIFFPFPVDGRMTYDNKAGIYQSVYETGGDFDPYEVDMTEEYTERYLVGLNKEDNRDQYYNKELRDVEISTNRMLILDKRLSIIFDELSGRVSINSKLIDQLKLNTAEFRFFQILYTNIGKVVSYDEIKKHVNPDKMNTTCSQYCQKLKSSLPQKVKKIIKPGGNGYILNQQ